MFQELFFGHTDLNISPYGSAYLPYPNPMAEIQDDMSSLSSESSEYSGLSYESKVTSNPMFYVLAQFLESPSSNKNIATLLEELVEELRLLRATLATPPAART